LFGFPHLLRLPLIRLVECAPVYYRFHPFQTLLFGHDHHRANSPCSFSSFDAPMAAKITKTRFGEGRGDGRAVLNGTPVNPAQLRVWSASPAARAPKSKTGEVAIDHHPPQYDETLRTQLPSLRRPTLFLRGREQRRPFPCLRVVTDLATSISPDGEEKTVARAWPASRFESTSAPSGCRQATRRGARMGPVPVTSDERGAKAHYDVRLQHRASAGE